LLIALMGVALPCFAEDYEDPNTRVAHFPGALWEDLGALPSTENGLWLLGGSALTAIVYQFEDPEAAAKFLGQPVLDELSDFGNIWGDIRVQAPLALGAWGVGSWTDNDKLAVTGFDLSRGLLVTYATVSLLKAAVQRTRPNGEDYSFPSGHTAAAFTTAGVLTRHYGGWVGGVAVGLGVLTGMGRLEDMKHYASDVVAGATIGWIVGRTVARGRGNDDSAWQLVPLGTGLAVAGRF
jgi:membrane-associated phospholipid phosphatase